MTPFFAKIFQQHPSLDTPLEKYHRHEHSLIQEFKDNWSMDGVSDEDNPAKKYLDTFENNIDDTDDIEMHLKILLDLCATINRVMTHSREYDRTMTQQHYETKLKNQNP